MALITGNHLCTFHNLFMRIPIRKTTKSPCNFTVIRWLIVFAIDKKFETAINYFYEIKNFLFAVLLYINFFSSALSLVHKILQSVFAALVHGGTKNNTPRYSSSRIGMNNERF